MVLNGENVVGWNTNLFLWYIFLSNKTLFLSNMIIFVKIFDCCEIRSEFYDFLLWNKNFLHILPAICGAFAKPPTLPVISIANNMWQQNISKKKHDSSSGLQTVIELAFVWRTSFQHISAYVLLNFFFKENICIWCTYREHVFHICCHLRCLAFFWCRSTYVCSKSHRGP